MFKFRPGIQLFKSRFIWIPGLKQTWNWEAEFQVFFNKSHVYRVFKLVIWQSCNSGRQYLWVHVKYFKRSVYHCTACFAIIFITEWLFNLTNLHRSKEYVITMAIRAVEFSNGGYKIRKVFAYLRININFSWVFRCFLNFLHCNSKFLSAYLVLT